MSFSNHGRFHEQVRFLRRQFLHDGASCRSLMYFLKVL
jgi:hypothetical protein